MKSPFPWKQHGQCGRWVSSVFPHVAGCVDDLAFLMAMASKTNVHGPASYMQNTGFVLPGFPCMGAWISYGLGRLTDNLPTFVVLPDPRGLPYNNAGNFSSGFLPHGAPGHHHPAHRRRRPSPTCFRRNRAKHITRDSEADGLKLLGELNRDHLAANPGDSRLEARIASYELAAKMQLSAPEALDLSQGTGARPPAVRHRRPGDRRLRPQLPDRPAAAGARRAFRAGLERHGRPVEQLGQPQQHSQGTAVHRRAGRQADRRAAARPQGARHVRGHAGDLDDGVRPDAVHAGRDRPRPQRRHLRQPGWPAPASRAAWPTAKATSSPTRPPTARPTATTCTPPSCTCSASTTRS